MRVSDPHLPGRPHTIGMTQADIPTWSVNFQLKLMAALDAVWATLERSTDPTEIRQARDKAKACGELAAMVRKVVMAVPAVRPKARETALRDHAAAGLHATQAMAELQAIMPAAAPAPAQTQADIARRALDKLKGGRRGRL